MKNVIVLFVLMTSFATVVAQNEKDTLKPVSTEIAKILKIHHAEPLYIDLIRDLGARKGEKEINFGFGIEDYKKYLSYSGFAEYEFAVADRLGLEIEVPFSFYQNVGHLQNDTNPQNRIEGLKIAAQYTFLVSEKHQSSMAVGYIHELKFASFSTIKHRRKLLEGNTYNPLFIVAKKWKSNIHALLYTGPIFEQHFDSKKINTIGQVNTSIHYVFSESGNFIGLETNMEFMKKDSSVTFRPQVKQKISDGLFIGFVVGIPTEFNNDGMSCMSRIIWEP